MLLPPNSLIQLSLSNPVEDPGAYSDAKSLIEVSVKWRTPGDTSSEVPYSAEKLLSLEHSYLGNWTKILTERR